MSPAAGDPRFRALLDELWALHRSKGGDYGTKGDNFANYHRAIRLGVRPSLSVMLRMAEKVSRLESMVATGRTPNHESVQDNLRDIAAQALIALILLAEEAEQGDFGEAA